MSSSSEQSDEHLAETILQENNDISPLFEDVLEHVRKFRACGLNDEKVREAVAGMYRVRQKAIQEDQWPDPAPDEIRVVSLPGDYQRRDWR